MIELEGRGEARTGSTKYPEHFWLVSIGGLVGCMILWTCDTDELLALGPERFR